MKTIMTMAQQKGEGDLTRSPILLYFRKENRHD